MVVLNPCGISSEVLMARKRNKSDSYQHKIVEISVDPFIIGDFPISNGLGAQLNLAKHSEEFHELKEQLIEEIYRIINENLTPRQAQVMLLRLQGKTQMEIAEQLQIHQTTCHKLISGNLDYKHNRKRYGGAIKKLKKVCEQDKKIQEILENIRELKVIKDF